MAGNQARRLLRAEGEHQVSNTELFFDLVFIFAFTRLTRALVDGHSLVNALEIALLFAAIWWVWTVTAWSTDWFDPEVPYVRAILLWVMLGSLLMAAAVPAALKSAAPVFAVTYVAIHLGRGGGLMYGLRGSPALVRSARVAIWFAATAVLWIAGAYLPAAARDPLWAVAILIDSTLGLIGYPVPGLGATTQEQLRIVGGHLSERHVQLFIVAVGDLVLVTGLRFANAGFDAPHSVAFVLSFANAILLTQLRFLPREQRIGPAIDGSRSPGRVALVTSYPQFLLLGGVLASAAGDELIVAQSTGSARLGTAMLLVSGTGLFLAGRILLPVITRRSVPRMSVGGLVVLPAVIPATAALPAYAVTAAVDLILLSITLADLAVARWAARRGSGGPAGQDSGDIAREGWGDAVRPGSPDPTRPAAPRDSGGRSDR
ncbi:low temperature requirement protein A [Rugosimonospora africana]|nr:low temperature requirement protein A [Rugosimonospora africana]